MPKAAAKPLTVKGVEAKTEAGLYALGGNLYLKVLSPTVKSWVVRYVPPRAGEPLADDAGRRVPKRRDFSLGTVQTLSLVEARAKAAQIMKQIKQDRIDPAEDREVAKAAREAARQTAELVVEQARHTFESCARERHQKLTGKWKNAQHRDSWLSSLVQHAFPFFGAKPIQAVTRSDVERALHAIWTVTPETGRRVRQRISDVFEWAKGMGRFSGDSPVDGIAKALPEVPRRKAPMPALPWRDVPNFYDALDRRDGMSARCLQWIILTASRSGEARGARWDEIEGATWTVPGERMKRGVAHRVALSKVALDVLDRVRGLDPVFIFPSSQPAKDGTARAMSDMVFKALFERMGVSGFVTHGFRSSFRDWCADSAHADFEVAEAALSHTVGNAVSQAYARSDLLERRRDLMEAWARFCTGEAGQVVELVRRA